jgi:ABC-type sugar transport system substrate-binding protein
LAKQKGIVVIANNTPIDGDAHSSYIESDAFDLGRQTGAKAREYIEKKLGGKAKIAIVEFKSLIPEQSDARTSGFKSEVTRLPGVQIVADQDAWLPEKAVSKVTDILTAHPDVDLVWSANEGGTVGAVLAVKNAGKAGKVVVFGTDASDQLVGFLLSPDNILQAITSQRPVESGRMAVEFAVKVKKGETVPKRVSMKGILLSRDDVPGVKAFQAKLAEWTGAGSQ